MRKFILAASFCMPEPTYRYKKGNITNLTTPGCQQYVSP